MRNKSHKAVLTKSKLKKDPGVPRLPDLKQKRNVQNQRRPSQSLDRPKLDPDSTMASEPTLSSLAQLAEASIDTDDVVDPSSSSGSSASRRKHYIRTLHKVIDESDIVILVLDARDAEGCRSRLVEEEVRRREGEGKKLVFVLNKIDLVPRANAEAWLKYLRHSTPTLPFKASTQQQRNNLVSKTSPALLKLLKSYKKGSGTVTVGVVGYPNVGKSSLINSLRRAKVCAVAAEAGHTKEMQTVQVERGVRVLDSPGVVFDDDEQAANSVLLRNVMKVEDVPDPVAVVDQILTRTDSQQLRNIYKLPEFTSTAEFLTMLAMTTGKLQKGGAVDGFAAARQVIQDWNSQKIPYWTNPPSVHPSNVPATVSAQAATKYGIGEGATVAPGAEDVGQAQIVNQFAPTFNLGELFSQADQGAFVPDAEMHDDEDQGLPMESDDLTPSVPRKRSHSPEASTDIASVANEAGPSRPSDAAQRPPKRIKKDPLSYDTAEHVRSTTALAAHNPLSRKAQKLSAKRARKAERKAMRARHGGGGGMEVDDDDGGLRFTFMAGPEGVVM